jgi:hypothetical protein
MTFKHKDRFCTYPDGSFSENLRSHAAESLSGYEVLSHNYEVCTLADSGHLVNLFIPLALSYYAGASVFSNPPIALPNNG